VLPAGIATPLAVVLNELLQNAVDHAYPEALDLTDEPGRVTVVVERTGQLLTLRVSDDGVGLPDRFDLDSTTGLGLSIVRTLVTTDLAGDIAVRRGAGDTDRPGTEVDLRVPIAAPNDDDLAGARSRSR
jgi:two-component system, sensor histidine kinase PdtaS